MALYDSPPHLTTLLSVASATDAGGGTSLSYTSAQASIPCSINTASASEVMMYGAQQIRVTHCVAYLSSVLTTVPSRGWKVTTDDRSETYRVHGIKRLPRT